MLILLVGPRGPEYEVVRDELRRQMRALDYTWPWCAHSLEHAKALLEIADGVISMDCFPTHEGRALEPSETQRGNWAGLALAVYRAKKAFVLLTRNLDLQKRLNELAAENQATTLFAAFPVDDHPAACRALLEAVRAVEFLGAALPLRIGKEGRAA